MNPAHLIPVLVWLLQVPVPCDSGALDVVT